MKRSKELCEKEGKHVVYVDFINKIHKLVTKHGKRMQYWGDIILEKPELIPNLPSDAVGLVWGYEVIICICVSNKNKEHSSF